MKHINPTSYFALLSALLLMSVAYKFIPDPYTREDMLSKGIPEKEVYRTMAIYFTIGLILLMVTTALFYKVIARANSAG